MFPLSFTWRGSSIYVINKCTHFILAFCNVVTLNFGYGPSLLLEEQRLDLLYVSGEIVNCTFYCSLYDDLGAIFFLTSSKKVAFLKMFVFFFICWQHDVMKYKKTVYFSDKCFNFFFVVLVVFVSCAVHMG